MLVGLVGYAQAGKDTFAGYLGYKRIAFADVLRKVAYDSIDPVLRKQWDEIGYERMKSETQWFRPYLQDLGCAVRDHIGPDTWVDAAFKDYDPAVPTVVTDVRFPNEIAKIRSLGGIIVRINRAGHAPANTHISEHAWQETVPDFAYTFADGALRHMEMVAKFLDLNLRLGA